MYNIPTTRGNFQFLFKKDRRRKKWWDVFSKTYAIEVIAPDGLTTRGESDYIANKAVLVVSLFLCRINKETLVKVLSEVYMDQILGQIESNS